MSVRSFAPGKEILTPRGAWTALAQKRKGSPERASYMQNCRWAPGVVRTRPGTSVIAPANGKVTGLFNWNAPSGTNYVLYRDGIAIRALEQASMALTPLVLDIRDTLRPSIADLDIWTYICGYEPTHGNGTIECRIFDGTNVDLAFAPPITLLQAGAVDAGDGLCSQGTHFLGFVYQNRTGFAGVPTTTLNGEPIAITLDSDKRKVNISVLLPPRDDGGGGATLYLIVTRADNPRAWYFLPTDDQTGSVGEQPVPAAASATLNFVFNYPDEDIAASLDSADEQFRYLTQTPQNTGPFFPSFVNAYGQRMCYGAGTKMYVSEINNSQQLTEDRHTVVPPNKRLIRYAFPLPNSTDLYLTGDKWTSRITDNGDVPATWAQPIKVSDALGAPWPACVCFRTGGNHAWIVTEAGPYLFTGTYAERPLTYLCSDIWKRVNWAASYAIETADDVAGLTFYVAVPLDGATEPTHLLVFDYTNGKGYDEVDFSLDKFQRPTFSSIGVVQEVTTQDTRLWIGPPGGNQDTYSFTVSVTDANGDTDSVNCSIDVRCPN